MSLSWTQCAPIVGVVFALYFGITRITVIRRGGKQTPGPKGKHTPIQLSLTITDKIQAYPFIGNLLDLASANGNLVPLFAQWAKQYGPVVQFDLFGEPQVVISDEAIVHDLFVKRGNIYSDRSVPHAIYYILREMSPGLMPKNDVWRRERKLIHSAISISVNEKYQACMREEAISAVQDILRSPGGFDEQFQKYTSAVIGRCFFGLRIESVLDPFVTENAAFLDETMEAFDPVAYPINLFPFLRFLPTWALPSLRKMDRLRAVNDAKVANLAADMQRQIEAQNKQEKDQGTDQLGIFNEFLANRSQYDISDTEANNAFFALIGAGTRSTHNALLTFIYLMLAHPDWQTKLQSQLDAVCPDRLPEWSDIPALPVLRAVVKESVRYRSIIAELGLPHRLTQDDEYEGYEFKKGTTFHANFGTILMNPKTYPDQSPFNPDRWLDPSYPTYREPLSVHPNFQNFTPFGQGRRACPGYDFAERSLLMMVAVLAWRCDIKKPIDAQGREYLPDVEFEKTPNPKMNGLKCRIVAREGREI
ncbi:cytochrome P450 [Setomelanomma holmii]|uniref:Cytochrome P450 n=1 Tax=Setomelanomma holmii TaxID=210430 RepID=A0A9P4H224_9PLEO|nr:cytochrome P450 [Setomelanomma holmii]